MVRSVKGVECAGVLVLVLVPVYVSSRLSLLFILCCGNYCRLNCEDVSPGVISGRCAYVCALVWLR